MQLDTIIKIASEDNGITMRYFLVTLLGLTLSLGTYAHSGEKPEQAISKLDSKLAMKRLEYFRLKEDVHKLENLEAQMSYIAKSLEILRHALAKDYPHVKEGMSKYKIDYMAQLESNLENLKKATQSSKALIAKTEKSFE